VNPGPGLDESLLRPEEIEEIRRTFFDQGRAALDELGQQVLALEGQLPTPALLRLLRRTAHTLKGDCGSVGFPELSRLAHALEDAFVELEGLQERVSAEQGDLLLAAVDALRLGLDAGAAGRAGADVSPMIERLRSIGRPGGFAFLDEEGQRVLSDGLARGRSAVQLRLELSASTRDVPAVLRRIVQGLSLELLVQRPALVKKRGPCRVDLFGLSEEDAPALRARLARRRGLRAEVRAWNVEAGPSVRPTGEGEGPARGLVRAEGDGARSEGEMVRIEARRVDEVLNLIGEMVTARSTIAGVAAEIEGMVGDELGARLVEAQSLLERVLQDLQRSAMRMRMAPAERVFRRFSRVVRDLGRQTGKRLTLRIEGETTELDRGILDALEEPLLHLVRNAVDHGIEKPEERRAAGKPEEGRVTLRASREGNQILIEVIDDGRGIDPQAVRQAARDRGLLTPTDEGLLSDDDALQLVFRPGLSTAAVVTETSGRGVGLDVVMERVEALKGAIRAANLPDGGASFLIRMPLTVAIIQALLFRVGARLAAVPLTAVVEIARTANLSVQRLGAQDVFRLRESALSLVHLGSLLGLAREAGNGDYVIVLQTSAGRFGIRVDDLVGEEELVIKAVHDRWVRTPLVAGAAVVGGGALVLILDALAVYRAALGRKTVANA
jgi:two-component system, chemotaxis family, sensor kinase CheA